MEQAILLDEVLIALRRILRATEINSKRLSKEVGLSFPQLLLMQKLHNKTDATASYLANELSLSQATITTIVDRLEKRTLVERIRSTQDRRHVHITLLPEGEKLLDSAPTALQESFIDELQTLEDWQQTMILSSLQKVASMMNAEKLDASPVLDLGPLDKPSA